MTTVRPRWLREQQRLRKECERYPWRRVTRTIGPTSQVTPGTNFYDWVTDQTRMWGALR